MKLSEVTAEGMAEYLRLDEPGDVEFAEIGRMMEGARDFIRSYTGLDDGELDKHEDITQAYHILVADMFDNRNLYIDGKASNVNKSVECILGMHSINLL